jgi:hypothetical protein
MFGHTFGDRPFLHTQALHKINWAKKCSSCIYLALEIQVSNEALSFFWFLLKDRLSTRDMLQRKNMELDNYTCDLCTLQKLETLPHLFLRVNFAKDC